MQNIIVERVARAISWASIGDEIKQEPVCATEEDHWIDPRYFVLARAAISARRETTDKMRNAAGESNAMGDNLGPHETWIRMIDAILED